MHRAKGQSLIFEQVLLFAIGIVIFISSFAVFRVYEAHFLSVTVNDQINEIKDWMVSNILELSKKDINSSVILRIPKRVDSQPYEIRLSNSGINVTALITFASTSSNLYGLNESMEFEGRASSDSGKIIIYKKGDKIIIQ